MIDERPGTLDAREFGRYVKRLREDRKIGLREMARRMGVSATFLMRAESQDRDLRTAEHVAKLASILGVDPEDLRRRAGLELLPFDNEWFFKLAEIAQTLLNAHTENAKVRRLYGAAAFLLMWVWSNAVEAWNDGKINEEALAKLEEMVSLVVAVIERKHPGFIPYYIYYGTPKEGQAALYEIADTVLARLYDMHRDEIEGVLTGKLAVRD